MAKGEIRRTRQGRRNQAERNLQDEQQKEIDRLRKRAEAKEGVLGRLQSGQQIEISQHNPSRHELEEARNKGLKVVFRLAGGTDSPRLTIIYLLESKSGTCIEVKDEQGNVYKVSCYREKGGPGHMKRIDH